MLTLFAAPKPFVGHIGVIQRNALESWSRLRPAADILLFGTAAGVAEAAAQWRCRHVPQVACSEFGTPLVNDMFETAQRIGQHDIQCYGNSDIVLMSDFGRAVQELNGHKGHFLIVGQRWDLSITEPLGFDSDWQTTLQARVRQHATLHAPTGIDYFVFRRGQWRDLPAFAVGRVGYDNWLIYHARRSGTAVIDASAAIMAVHQNHDYSHLPNGKNGIVKGPEAVRNLALVGGEQHLFTIEDANWLLSWRGAGLVLTRQPATQRLRRWYEHRTTLRSRLRWIRSLFAAA